MIGLVCFEGLGPNSSYPRSFMKKLANLWPEENCAHYIFNGNAGLGKTIQQKAEEGEHLALMLLAQPGVDTIFLAGYSQGGAAAILVGQALQKHGHDVGLLALLDAVSADPGGHGIWFDPPISSNVNYAVHAYRNPTANSRPLWGNCGMASFVEKRNYWITHGGAGGTFYLENPAGPPNPGELVTETGLAGEVRKTNVTQHYEWANSRMLWDWYYGKIQRYRAHFSARTPKAKPVQPGPAPGNGNGGNGRTETHIVKSGESLSLISGKYWGDVLLWPILYDKNKSTVGSNHNLIKAGMKLIVPSIKGYSQGELNSVRQRGRSW